MTHEQELVAHAVYLYAQRNYGKKDIRYDVIVECMTIAEISAELVEAGITDEAGGYEWADEAAGLQHEVELNQAEDGPESCIGSNQYLGDERQSF